MPSFCRPPKSRKRQWFNQFHILSEMASVSVCPFDVSVFLHAKFSGLFISRGAVAPVLCAMAASKVGLVRVPSFLRRVTPVPIYQPRQAPRAPAKDVSSSCADKAKYFFAQLQREVSACEVP